MPTCAPGWNLVPRWRTMMLPGTTISPPYFLTPSRRPRLSRPLRDEPPAFLCAISHPLIGPRTAGIFDLGDAQHGLQLAVPLLAPVIVPPLLLEDDDLGCAALLDDRRADRSALEERRDGGDRRDLAETQHLQHLTHCTGL